MSNNQERLVTQGLIQNKYYLNGQPVIVVNNKEYVISTDYWYNLNIEDNIEIWESDYYGGYKIRIIEEYKQEPVKPIVEGTVSSKSVNFNIIPAQFYIEVEEIPRQKYIVNLLDFLILQKGYKVRLPTDNSDTLPPQKYI